MNQPILRGVLSLLACSTSFLAGAPGVQDSAPPPPQGNLRRVDPHPRDPNDPRELFARDFDREEWKERLLEGDLDRREDSLDALLKRARLDPIARAFVEELARDPKGGELAWTARLALRELGSANVPFQGFLGADPFGSARRMQDWMEELFGRDGSGLIMPIPHLAQRAPLQQGSQGSARSVQVEQTGSGAKVRITEVVDGQEQTREYAGRSLDEILETNKELEADLGGLSIRVGAGSPLSLNLDLGNRADRSSAALRRFQRKGQGGLRLQLQPQGKSRPILTDRLGVIVQPVSPARAKELGLEGRGLLVESAVPETYAQLLGVKAGDVLLELNGIVLVNAADIERAMRERSASDALTLVWLDELGQRQAKTWEPPDSGKR